MQHIIEWMTTYLGQIFSKEGIVFFISLLPILELRGGLLAASILGVEATKAIPIAVIGNILPIPFILLFIQKIFAFLKKFNFSRKWILKLEERAMKKSEKLGKYEFIGLLLFVGIPLPGTGAWTGALIASLLNMKLKKSSLAIFLGIVMATLIMYVVSYVMLGRLF